MDGAVTSLSRHRREQRADQKAHEAELQGSPAPETVADRASGEEEPGEDQ